MLDTILHGLHGLPPKGFEKICIFLMHLVWNSCILMLVVSNLCAVIKLAVIGIT